MSKTLLLCFIHGFKGGDDTFAGFPEHLRALASHALPNVTVKAVTYPKFETRGDLQECVGRFREWLQNKVIDLEVAASTSSPTVDPSVHTILIGHSMGGIVAAEALLATTSDSSIPSPKDPLPSMASQTVPGSQPPPADSEGQTFMFPYIQGILAFDTPYLGISPGVVAHSAEQHYKTVTGAYSALSDVAGVLGYGASKKDTSPKQQQHNQRLLTQGADAMSASMTNATSDAAAVPAWQRWGKYAMFAGAAGAVAAGGAAAYLKRETITEGWSFIGSHLEFVGCLARGEELKSRLERIVELNKDRNIGFADVITVLGKGAIGDKKSGTPVPNTGGFVEIGSVDGIAPSERTFCTVPKSEKNRKFFEKAKNDKARDEMQAHMTMFTARENSGYFTLGERSRDLIVQWVRPEASEWYRESEPEGGIKKVMMDVDLGGDETESNPWAGDEPVIPQASSEDINDHGATLPKWIDEYNRCLKSPQRREDRAAVAISAIETDRGLGDAVAPRRPHVRHLKLGPPKRELGSAKASGRNGEADVTTPTTPQTPPRRRPPKLGRAKADLESMKQTEADDEGRSATPDVSLYATPPQSGQPKADIELKEGRATPEGQRRRPPKLGRPKAEPINMASEPKSDNAKPSTSSTETQGDNAEMSMPISTLKSAKTVTSTTTLESDGAEAGTSTTILGLKNDEADTNTTTPGPDSAQAEANKATPDPDIVNAETSVAAPEPNSAKVEVGGTAPDLSRAPELEIEGAGGTKPDGQRPRPKPPKLGRPKAELDAQKPRKLAKEDGNPTPEKPYTKSPKLGKTKVRLESNRIKPSQTPKEANQKARDATPEEEPPPKAEGKSNNNVKDASPRTGRARPPKLKELKVEPKSLKPSKLVAKKDTEAPTPTPEKPAKAGIEPEEMKSEQAPKVDGDKAPEGPHPAPSKLEAKSVQDIHTTPPPTGRARPPKLGRSKAELESTRVERAVEGMGDGCKVR